MAWDVLRDMRAAAGFQALTPDEQTRVVTYVGGHTSLSTGGAAAIRAVLNDPARAADPEAFRRAMSQQTGQPLLGEVREPMTEHVHTMVHRLVRGFEPTASTAGSANQGFGTMCT